MDRPIGSYPSSQHKADVAWVRGDQLFANGQYSRVHSWKFDGGAEVLAAASPHVVRIPYTDPAGVDPEEAFLAAIGSCHMLWFLALASKAGFCVDSYTDSVVGTMEKNSEGKIAITNVLLNPQIAFSGSRSPSADEIDHLHHKAHEECFIANSVRCEISWVRTQKE